MNIQSVLPEATLSLSLFAAPSVATALVMEYFDGRDPRKWTEITDKYKKTTDVIYNVFSSTTIQNAVSSVIFLDLDGVLLSFEKKNTTIAITKTLIAT